MNGRTRKGKTMKRRLMLWVWMAGSLGSVALATFPAMMDDSLVTNGAKEKDGRVRTK